MRKYTFSQGKIWMEDSLYRPVLKEKAPDLDSFVLIFLPLSEKKPEKPTLDKEKKLTTTI